MIDHIKGNISMSNIYADDGYFFSLQPIKVVQYNINTEELYSYLKEFIHMLYFR